MLKFVNIAHNGDIFISSKFIKDIKQKLSSCNISYYLRLTGQNPIIKDTYSFLNIPIYDINEHLEYNTTSFITIINGIIVINTWVGVFNDARDGECVYLPMYYDTFKELYRLLNIPLEPIDYYIPSFIYENNITKQVIDKFYKNTNKINILFCTGTPQSCNERFSSDTISEIIRNLIYHNFFVKVTHEEFIKDKETLELYLKQYKGFNNDEEENIITIKHTGLDQNELIASNCKFVIGPNSGLFLNTMTPNTLNTIFLYITSFETRVYEKFHVKKIDYNTYNWNNILQYIT